MKKGSNGSFSPLLHLTYVLQQLSDDSLLEATGVGLSQTRIMSVLSDNISRSQNWIAHELGQTEANVSRQLRVMKRRSLVSISKNKKDNRQRDVKLSGKGTRTYKTAVKVLNAQQARMFKLFDRGDLKAFEQGSKHLLIALNVRADSRRKL